MARRSTPTTDATAQTGTSRCARRARRSLAAPARRKLLGCLRLHPPQRIVERALDLLEDRGTAGRGAMDALEAERQAGMHQFQSGSCRPDRLGAVELLEETHAADALAEEAAQHAVLRPDVAVFAGMFWTMSSAVAESAYFATRICSAGNPVRQLLLEFLDRLGHLLHQRHGRRPHDVGAEPSEEQEQRPRRAHDRAFVGLGRRAALAGAGRPRVVGEAGHRGRRRRRPPAVGGPEQAGGGGGGGGGGIGWAAGLGGGGGGGGGLGGGGVEGG